MNPPETCEELFISERRKALSRVTVWLMVKQVAAAAWSISRFIPIHYGILPVTV
jgi:hypothetical protein